MIQTLITAFFLIFTSAYVYTYTSHYERTKEKLKTHIVEYAKQEAFNNFFGKETDQAHQDPLEMMKGAMKNIFEEIDGKINHAQPVQIDTRKSIILGPKKNILLIRFTLEGKPYDVLLKMKSTKHDDNTLVYALGCNGSDMLRLHLHTGIPLNITANDIGATGVQITKNGIERTYEANLDIEW